MKNDVIKKPFIGKKFDSLYQFMVYISDYEDSVQETFTIAHSESLKEFNYYTKNICATDRENNISKLQKRNISLKCKYGYNKASTAQERQSSTYGCGCKAVIKAALSKDKIHLEIKQLQLEHNNHPKLAQELRHTLPENRRLPPELKNEVKQLLDLGCNHQRVKDWLLQNKGKMVFNKDISNLRQQNNNSNDKKGVNNNSLQTCLKILNEENDYTVFVRIKDNNVLKGIYFTNEAMKEYMKRWGEVLFIDFTYNLVNTSLALCIIAVRNGSGRGIIVAGALVSFEDADTIEWIARSHQKAHPIGCQFIKTIITDKDMTERAGFKKVFPNVSFYLCVYHTLKTFRRQLDTKNVRNPQCWDLLQRLVFTPNENKYLELYNELKTIAPSNFISYFNENWHKIRDQWTYYNISNYNYTSTTNNTVESINNVIHKVLDKRATLSKFIKDFLIFWRTQTQETFLLESRAHLKRVNNDINDPTISSYFEYLTDRGYKIWSPQIVKFHQYKTVDIVECRTSEKVFEGYIYTDSVCSCNFFRSNHLPCRHILYKRSWNSMPLFDAGLCALRWTKKYTEGAIVDLLKSDKAAVLPPIEITIAKPAKIDIVGDRINLANNYSTELLELCKLSVGEFFHEKIALLEAILVGWTNNCSNIQIIQNFKHQLLLGNSNKEVNKNNIPNNYSKTISTVSKRIKIAQNYKSKLLKLSEMSVAEFFNEKIVLLETFLSGWRQRLSNNDILDRVSTPLVDIHNNNNIIQNSTKINSGISKKKLNKDVMHNHLRSDKDNSEVEFINELKIEKKYFYDLSMTAKIKYLLSLLVRDEDKLEAICNEEILILKSDLSHLHELPDPVMNVTKKLIGNYFDDDAWGMFEELKLHKKNSEWKCHCSCDKVLSGMTIQCGICLFWYNYTCMELPDEYDTSGKWNCQMCNE